MKLLTTFLIFAQITTNPGPTQYPFGAWASKGNYDFTNLCSSVHLAWNETRAVALENYQAYELRWYDFTKGTYTYLPGRGAAGTIITKVSVCSSYVSELQIRFGKNCQRDDINKVWYDKTNICTWGTWEGVWIGQNVFPPEPPTIFTYLKRIWNNVNWT